MGGRRPPSLQTRVSLNSTPLFPASTEKQACNPPPCLRSPHVSSSQSKIHVSASLPYRTPQASHPPPPSPPPLLPRGTWTYKVKFLCPSSGKSERAKQAVGKAKAKEEENQRVQTPWAERHGVKRAHPVQRCNPSPEPRTRSDSVFAGVCTSERVQGRSYNWRSRTPHKPAGPRDRRRGGGKGRGRWRGMGMGRVHRAGERAHTREENGDHPRDAARVELSGGMRGRRADTEPVGGWKSRRFEATTDTLQSIAGLRPPRYDGGGVISGTSRGVQSRTRHRRTRCVRAPFARRTSPTSLSHERGEPRHSTGTVWLPTRTILEIALCSRSKRSCLYRSNCKLPLEVVKALSEP